MVFSQFVPALLGWLPVSLQLLAAGVIAIFSIVVLLRIVSMVLDVIPFL